jgi:hypothetical protein
MSIALPKIDSKFVKLIKIMEDKNDLAYEESE